MASKNTLELNPSNPIIEELNCKVAQDKTRLTRTSQSATWPSSTYLLFETTLLTSYFVLNEPISLAKLIHHMNALGPVWALMRTNFKLNLLRPLRRSLSPSPPKGLHIRNGGDWLNVRSVIDFRIFWSILLYHILCIGPSLSFLKLI